MPSRWRRGPDADLGHLPISLDLRALSIAEGIRAALSVAVLVAANEWLRLPALNEAALAALLTCLCDAGGPVRRRVPALLMFAVLGAILTAGLGALRPLGLPVVVPLACAVIFCTSFARVWGQSPLQVGNLLTVVTVLALDRGEDLRTAATLGLFFLGGSLWALLLTMVIWRLHPYRPARRAVAEVYRRLGTLAGDLSALAATAEPPTHAWADHARAHRRHVRDGIEAARTLLLDTIRGRGAASPRAGQTLIQVEAADQLFGALIALSDVLEAADAQTRAAAARELSLVRLLLAAIADETRQDEPANDPAARAALEGMLEKLTRLGAGSLAGITASMVTRMRIALLLTTPAGMLPEPKPEAGGPNWRTRLTQPLRANLAWSSAGFRHALRAAVVAAPALAYTLHLGTTYAHWLTITLVLTLQPFFALTWQRAVERIGGTVLGGLIAAGVAVVVHTPLTMAAALFPLAVLALSVRYVSFGLFMAGMTPLVVLLSELGRPGTGELQIALLRAAYTLAGGVLAVLGCWVLWPSWEPNRVQQELRGALQAHARYADLELATLLQEAPDAALDAARRAAGMASNNLEASLSRALQEPRRAARAGLETAMTVDAALRRLAGRLSALQHDPALAGDFAPEALRAWREWLAAAFAALTDGAPLPGGLPAAEGTGPLARIARQLELMDGALRRTPQPSTGGASTLA
ncbi:MAG TPA: FUSC family protein [Acetobacteraceae bacterium]